MISHGVAVNVSSVGDGVELVTDGPHQVGEGAEGTGGSTVVEVKAESILSSTLPGTSLWRTAVELSVRVRQEDMIGCSDNVVDIDDTAKVGDDLVLDHKDEHENCLDHQLPEGGLGDGVEECLAVEVELDLSGRHLLGDGLVENVALDTDALTAQHQTPQPSVEARRNPVEGPVQQPPPGPHAGPVHVLHLPQVEAGVGARPG